MKLYKDYLATKHSEDDFLRWLLIRRMTLKHQLIVISILWLVWILVAPHLAFWVIFFKGTLLYWCLSNLILFLIRKFKPVSSGKGMERDI